MGALTKAALLDKRREKVELQGGHVYVVSLSAEDFYNLIDNATGQTGKAQTAALIEAATVNENGERIFDEGDGLKLGYREFLALSNAVQRVNGLDDEAVEKN